MERTAKSIGDRWSAATPGPWWAGGPVERSALLNPANLSGALTKEVWEVGHTSDQTPPGICVVNNYFLPGRGETEADQRWSAKVNAEAIAAAPADVAWLLMALELEGGHLTMARGWWWCGCTWVRGDVTIEHGGTHWAITGIDELEQEVYRYLMEAMDAAEPHVRVAGE